MNTGYPRMYDLLSRRGGLAVSLALLAVFGVVDLLTRTEIIFSVFYLLPVITASWFAGWRAGFLVSFASTVLLYLADLASGRSITRSLLVFWDAAGRLIFFLVIAYFLSILRDALRHERELARTDPVTGAANSRAFYELAERELNRARRFGYAITVAYMDIDNFKAVNDTWGHTAGDRLLQAVADTLQRSVRAIDVVARVGGDEFIVMLPKAAYREAHDVLQRIHDNLHRRMGEHRWPVTLSIGAVSYGRAGNSIDEIIRAADQVMYKVKRGSKDSIVHEVVE